MIRVNYRYHNVYPLVFLTFLLDILTHFFSILKHVIIICYNFCDYGELLLLLLLLLLL